LQIENWLGVVGGGVAAELCWRKRWVRMIGWLRRLCFEGGEGFESNFGWRLLREVWGREQNFH
jgi:hypothetical protein